MFKFQLSKDEATKLLESYRDEIARMRKHLDAVVSLAFLMEKYLDQLPKEEVSHE